MQYFIYFILDFYARYFTTMKINIKEPFEGLFIKEWFAMKHIKILIKLISPDEIETINGNKFLRLIPIPVKVDQQKQCQNQKYN